MKSKVITILVIVLVFTASNTVTEEVGIDPVVKNDPLPVKTVKSDWAFLVEALIQVESEGNQYAIGKTKDVGILQITPIYVADVNRILGADVYTLSHRTDIDKSLEMFEIYQNHYNPDKNITKAIKLHNPGAGQSYMNKVMNEFNKLKEPMV